jgi:AcrR family transcriptional regulator
VGSDRVGFVRARRPEQKRLREAAILDAARELALRDGVGAVSLAAIAVEVGMHKSALLKYFGTREEIFLRLSEGEWRGWAEQVVADVAAGGAAGLPDALGRSIAGRPLFCQLLTHSTLTLERNVSLDAVRRSKAAALAATDAVADAVHRVLPDLDRDSCFDLVAATGVIAAGLWQAANPPAVVLAYYAEQAAGGCAPNGLSRLAGVDLPTELARFVRVFVAGLRTEGRAPGGGA